MSAATVEDAICKYFGGPYDPVAHNYHSSPLVVPGVAIGAVRRAKPKRLDAAEYFLGVPGAVVGCLIYIQVLVGSEVLEGLGGAQHGMTHLRHRVQMDCLLRSGSSYAEDTADAQLGLQAAIANRIRADRTCGSGGIENNGFDVGVPGTPGITWQLFDPVTKAEETRALVRLLMVANEYVIF